MRTKNEPAFIQEFIGRGAGGLGGRREGRTSMLSLFHLNKASATSRRLQRALNALRRILKLSATLHLPWTRYIPSPAHLPLISKSRTVHAYAVLPPPRNAFLQRTFWYHYPTSNFLPPIPSMHTTFLAHFLILLIRKSTQCPYSFPKRIKHKRNPTTGQGDERQQTPRPLVSQPPIHLHSKQHDTRPPDTP